MYLRWTLKCVDRETGGSVIRTVVARSQLEADNEIANLGFIVEAIKAVDPCDPPVDPPVADGLNPRDRGGLLPSDRICRIGWWLVGAGLVLGLCGLGLVYFGGSRTLWGVMLAPLGQVLLSIAIPLIWMGWFAVVISTAAVSITLAVIYRSTTRRW